MLWHINCAFQETNTPTRAVQQCLCSYLSALLPVRHRLFATAVVACRRLFCYAAARTRDRLLACFRFLVAVTRAIGGSGLARRRTTTISSSSTGVTSSQGSRGTTAYRRSWRYLLLLLLFLCHASVSTAEGSHLI